jgi:hypothetical protein
LGTCFGQYKYDEPLYAQLLEERLGILQTDLEMTEEHFPREYVIPIDEYRFDEPTGYTMNVIFDPCRGKDVNCCDDTFGTPEFSRVDTAAGDKFRELRFYQQSGELLSYDFARVPDKEVVLDTTCKGFLDPRDDCISDGVGTLVFPQTPACWNHNATISALPSCRNPRTGAPMPLCFEGGFVQTAFIMECNGRFKDDPHCGTFLEIHKPGSTEALSATKLRGQYTSGYRMSVMTTTVKGDNTKVLCNGGGGSYEVWWVMRTRYDFIVQKKIPFRVIEPDCSFDPINNEYYPYIDLGNDTSYTVEATNQFLHHAVAGTSGDTSQEAGQPGMGQGNAAWSTPQVPQARPAPTAPPASYRRKPPKAPGSYNVDTGNSDWGGAAKVPYDLHPRKPEWGGNMHGGDIGFVDTAEDQTARDDPDYEWAPLLDRNT